MDSPYRLGDFDPFQVYPIWGEDVIHRVLHSLFRILSEPEVAFIVVTIIPAVKGRIEFGCCTAWFVSRMFQRDEFLPELEEVISFSIIGIQPIFVVVTHVQCSFWSNTPNSHKGIPGYASRCRSFAGHFDTHFDVRNLTEVMENASPVIHTVEMFFVLDNSFLPNIGLEISKRAECIGPDIFSSTMAVFSANSLVNNFDRSLSLCISTAF